jgi:microcystin-dependent protein
MYTTRLLAVLVALAACIADAAALAQTPAAPPTLLTYAVSPSPDPLQVSGPASLRVVASTGGTDTVTVRSLVFRIIVRGSGAPDAAALTYTDRGAGLEGPAGWTFTSLGEGVFRATPAPPDTAFAMTTQGLVFTIGNLLVNEMVGTTTLTIVESAWSAGQDLQPRRAVVPLPKFPVKFTAGDLAPSRPRVGFGETVTLQWRGSDADYRIAYGGDTAVIPPRARTWTSPPLEEATTFVLVARAQEGGSTVEDHFPVTVQVDTPSVRAHDLTVRGPSTLQGTVQAGADLRVGTDVRAGGRVYDAAGVVLPPGGIILWAGRTDQVPQGWVLCDGQNGTPDLRGRFVVGWNPADTAYASVGKTGGVSQVVLTPAQLPAHAHEGTTWGDGTHYHVIEGTSANGLAWRPRWYRGDSTVDLDWGGGSNADPRDNQWRGEASTNDSGGHTHRFTTNVAGEGQPHENRPPYYVLAYIMKL